MVFAKDSQKYADLTSYFLIQSLAISTIPGILKSFEVK